MARNRWCWLVIGALTNIEARKAESALNAKYGHHYDVQHCPDGLCEVVSYIPRDIDTDFARESIGHWPVNWDDEKTYVQICEYLNS